MHYRAIADCFVYYCNSILVSEGGTPVLCDFGVSKMHESQTLAAIPTAVTTAVQSSLTPAYAAPEVLLQKPSGPQADIFAVGVCLWQATFGDMPNRDVATFGLTAESKRRIATPSPVDNLLRVLLADDKDDRPSAMDSLLSPYFADTHEVSRKVIRFWLVISVAH